MRKKVKFLMLFVLMFAAALTVKQTGQAAVKQYQDVNRASVRVNGVNNGVVDFDVLYKGQELTRDDDFRLSQCDVYPRSGGYTVSMTITGIKSGGFMGDKFMVFKLVTGRRGITVVNNAGTAVVGRTIDIDAYGGTGTLKFTSMKPSVARINANTGKLTGLKQGLAKIKVSDTGTDMSTTFYVHVNKSKLKSNDFKYYFDQSFNYTGSRIKPPVVIYGKMNGWKSLLRKNVDYTVTYSNNKNVGTATIKIQGINRYSGTVKRTFRIKKSSVALSGYIKDDDLLAGQATKIVIDPDTRAGRKLKFSSSNKNVAKVYSSGKVRAIGYGNATITVKAKGNKNIKASTIRFRVHVHSNGTKITSLTSKRTSDGSYNIYIRWKRYSDVEGYQIRWKRSGNSGKRTINDEDKYKATMTDCRSNTTYKIQIRTFWWDDDEREKVYSPWSDYKTIKTSTAKPSTPTLKIVRNPSGTRNIYVTWSKISAADGYQVEYKNLGTGYVGYHAVRDGDATSTVVTSMSGSKYRIRVRSYTSDGSTVYSNWSSSKTVSIADND